MGGGKSEFLWVEFDFAFRFQFDGFQKEAVQMVKPAKGTTTLAFIFKDGVIVAADSRASMGGYICMFIICFFCLDKFLVYGSVTWNKRGRLCLYVYLIHFWVNGILC